MRLRDDYTQDCAKGLLCWNLARRLRHQADAAECRVPPDRRIQGRARRVRWFRYV